jgi:hypothetical protein
MATPPQPPAEITAGAQQVESSVKAQSVEQPKAEPLGVLGRKALIATVVAIAFNPVSLVAGYFINHSLQAPKLEIQYATPVHGSEAKKIGDHALQLLKKNPRMAAALRSVVFQRAPAGETPQPICTAWMDGQEWDDNCRGIISDSMNGILQESEVEIRALTRNIKILQDSKPGQHIVLEPVNIPDSDLIHQMQAIQGGRFDRTQAIAQFQYYLDQDLQMTRALKSLAKDFQKMADLPDTLTSDLWLDIGILNSGDSDGVVFNSGSIQFGGKRLLLNTDKYTVVKAHSFETIRFRVSYGQPDDEQKKIQDAAKNGPSDDFPFNIELKVGATAIEGKGVLPKNEQ